MRAGKRRLARRGADSCNDGVWSGAGSRRGLPWPAELMAGERKGQPRDRTAMAATEEEARSTGSRQERTAE